MFIPPFPCRSLKIPMVFLGWRCFTAQVLSKAFSADPAARLQWRLVVLKSGKPMFLICSHRICMIIIVMIEGLYTYMHVNTYSIELRIHRWSDGLSKTPCGYPLQPQWRSDWDIRQYLVDSGRWVCPDTLLYCQLMGAITMPTCCSINSTHATQVWGGNPGMDRNRIDQTFKN